LDGWSKRTGHTYNLNPNFYTQMSAYSNELTSIQTEINKATQDNCDNQYTLISRSPGVSPCGLTQTANNLKTTIQPIQNISNDIVTQMSPTYPQYQNANNVNTTLHNYQNWDYKNEIYAPAPEYSSLNKQEIEDIYTKMEQNASTSYNDCGNNNTLISFSPATGKPYCISDKYDSTSTTCQSAISQASPTGFNYPTGYEELNNLWNGTKNKIEGNSLSNSNSILDSVQNSCNKWVQMFNVWSTDEAKAAATPCVPERTVQTTYDPVIFSQAENWNKSATLYIDSLMKRLEVIEKYIETYPNILELNGSNVTYGPSSLGASMMLNYNVNQMSPGVAPVQYLEMLVPNGKDGERGDIGGKGLPGEKGGPGPQGPTGPTGNPELPNIFQNGQNKCK